MNSLEEIAIEVAQKMDDVFLRNVPADVLRSYARRLVAALGAQKPVAWMNEFGTAYIGEKNKKGARKELQDWCSTPLFAAPVLPSVPEGMILVKTVKCQNCDDVGWYVVPGRDGEPEQEQCEFCETVPNSIFNISKIARLSAAPSPQEDKPLPAVSSETMIVPKEILDRFPEINPSNYDHDDVCALNAWGAEVMLAAETR